MGKSIEERTGVKKRRGAHGGVAEAAARKR